MNVNVAVQCWKRTTSSLREPRAQGRLSELICPWLNPPPVPTCSIAEPGWEGRDIGREENEEHLHLNGMFSSLHFSRSHFCVMAWLCVDGDMRGNPLLLLVALILNRNLHLNSSYSCLFFVLCCFYWTLVSVIFVIPPLLGERREIHLVLHLVSLHVTPHHIWHSQRLCHHKALAQHPTLTMTSCFSSRESMTCLVAPGSCFKCAHTWMFLITWHRLTANPPSWCKHPVDTLHHILLQGNNESCTALYY